MRIASAILLASALAAGDAAPAAPAAVELPALPSSVSRNANLWFQEGKMKGGQDSLNIGLTAKVAERVRIVEVSDVELVEAIGDDGKPLRVHEHGSGGGSGGDISQLDVSINLDPPGAHIRALRSLVVSVHARVAAEGLRRATLKPAKDWIAKRMRIDGVAGGEIELENLGAESFTVGMTPALEKAIERLTFTTAAGDELEHAGWSDSQEPGWTVRTVETALPADGSILLDLRQDLGERRFTLRAVNIPIAMPDRAKEPVGVLKTEAVQDDENGNPGAALMPMPAAPVQVPAAPKPGF